MDLHYGDFHALKNVNLEIEANKITAFIGPSGCGKSTLLKKVNANPCDKTIKDEFLKWNKASGKVLNGLTRRRNAEAELYFK